MSKPAKEQKELSALQMIRAHHGSASVFGGNEQINFNVKATSTGSLVLDDAIGCGGIPDGRLVLWSGPESSGKTLGSLWYAKKKQAEGKRILFIDAEFTWDHSWVTKLGLKTDPEHMLVAQESSGVKIFDLLCGKPVNKHRKNPIPGILSDEVLKQMEEEGTPLGAIIVDSINTVQPPIEEDMDTGATQVGALSRFLPPVLRRLTPLLGKYGIPCIFICQARTNIMQMHGDPLTVSGGKALMHAASLWIDTRKIQGSEMYEDGDTEKEHPIGHQVRMKIRKNKVGPPSQKAEVTIYYERGVDIRPELLQQGIAREIIKKEGNTLFYSGFPGGKVGRQNDAETLIFTDKNLRNRLFADILDHRSNKAREAKKEAEEFVGDGEEDVEIVDKVNTRYVEEKGSAAKALPSEEVVASKIVTQNGKRIDSTTGEILPPLKTQPAANEDEFIPVTGADPAIDDEEQVVVLDAKDDLDTPVATTPVAVPAASTDLSTLTLVKLRDMAKVKSLKNWYKLDRDQLVNALK